MTRRSMSPARRKRILERDGYACRQCHSEEGPFEIDHMHEIWLDGPDEDDNLQTLCRFCHVSRTRDGAKRRAKVKRLAGITKRNRKHRQIYGRGFDKPPGYRHRWPKRKVGQ